MLQRFTNSVVLISLSIVFTFALSRLMAQEQKKVTEDLYWTYFLKVTYGDKRYQQWNPTTEDERQDFRKLLFGKHATSFESQSDDFLFSMIQKNYRELERN